MVTEILDIESRQPKTSTRGTQVGKIRGKQPEKVYSKWVNVEFGEKDRKRIVTHWKVPVSPL